MKERELRSNRVGTSRLARLTMRIGIPIAVVAGAGALAYAAVPHSFSDGDTLTAADLNANFAALQAQLASGGTTPPAGWLLCNGSAVSRTEYAGLFAAVGIAWGSGDGINTFAIPDLRGRFLRGLDSGGSTNDPQAARIIGSVQADAFKTHSHGGKTSGVSDFGGTDGFRDYNTLGCGQTGVGFAYVSGQNCLGGQFSTHTHPITADGAAETRPVNAAVNWIVKI
jgi:hypothetical protein